MAGLQEFASRRVPHIRSHDVSAQSSLTWRIMACRVRACVRARACVACGVRVQGEAQCRRRVLPDVPHDAHASALHVLWCVRDPGWTV
jgi:hypothetical protein